MNLRKFLSNESRALGVLVNVAVGAMAAGLVVAVAAIILMG
jgi:hypothetical protein